MDLDLRGGDEDGEEAERVVTFSPNRPIALGAFEGPQNSVLDNIENGTGVGVWGECFWRHFFDLALGAALDESTRKETR